jgi:hypothetical protein
MLIAMFHFQKGRFGPKSLVCVRYMSNFYEVKSLTDRYLVDFHDETLAIASEYDSDKAHTPWGWELRPLHHDTINRDPGMDEEALMDQREFGQHSAALSTPQGMKISITFFIRKFVYSS